MNFRKNNFNRRLLLRIYLSLVLLLVLICGVIYVAYSIHFMEGEKRQSELRDLRSLEQLRSQFKGVIRQSQDHLERIQKATLTEYHNKIRFIVVSAKSELGDSQSPLHEGNVFFRKPMSEQDASVIELSRRILPYMSWSTSENAFVRWTYFYAQNQKASSLYPFLSHEALKKTLHVTTLDSALDLVFDAGGTRPLELCGPQGNPSRQMKITQVYEDAAGTGLVASMLLPVYDRDHFLGVVGTDLGLEKLQSMLGEVNTHGMDIALIDVQNRVLASTNSLWNWRTSIPDAHRIRQNANIHLDRQFPEGSWLRLELGLGWELWAYRHNSHTWIAKDSAMWTMLMMGMWIAVSLGLVWFLFHRYLALPVLHLVDYIEDLSENPDRMIPEIPLIWSPWFSRLQLAAKERQRTFLELEHQQIQLEQIVAERTSRLEEEIEERKMLEESLVIAREAAERASQAKGNFLANMSHEIRTPLNAVIGLAHLVLASSIPVRQKDQVTRILRSGQALLSLLNDILDFSKIEAGKMQIERRPLRIHDLAEALLGLFEHQADEKGLQYNVLVNPDLPNYVYGDSMRLGQVLINLCSNALKFTEQGHVVVHIEHDGNYVHFRVEDTGLGMDLEQQSRLFVAFEQAADSTARKYGGTGLGLAISQQFIRLMGGEIGVQSEIGKGTVFYWTLEMPPVESQYLDDLRSREIVEDEQSELLRGCTVLLVEDNEVNRLVAQGLLESWGCVVEIAENGQDAVDYFERGHRAGLVLMDMQMPIMGGLEATRCLRQMGVGVPIIALTANAFADDIDLCLASGMDDHLAKPIDPAYFHEVLLRWVSTIEL